jgi:putative transposase
MIKKNPEQSGRRSIRLKGYNYSQVGGYYVTIVTRGREWVLGEVSGGEIHISPLGQIVDECWRSIPEHFPNVSVDAFVVMPNHVHGIIFIHETEFTRRGTIYRAPTANTISQLEKFGTPRVGSLATIIRTFKAAITRRAGLELNSGNIWQRNYYEHILRDEADYERVAGYILDNPANWEQDEENPDATLPLTN